MQKYYWLEHFEHPLTVIYKKKWRWWSAMELARRFIVILFVIPYPRNSVSFKFSTWHFSFITNISISVQQLPPLLVVCIALATYGYIKPYKSLFANLMEVVVQTNFIILLTLESNGFLRDTYNTFPPLLNDTVNITPNEVATCSDSFTGVSRLAIILLPFLYFPVLLFTIIAAVSSINKVIKFISHVQ